MNHFMQEHAEQAQKPQQREIIGGSKFDRSMEIYTESMRVSGLVINRKRRKCV